MELYLDSANLKEIGHAASLGILSGVTTNPSLIAREDPTVDVRSRILDIHRMVGGHCSVEVISTDTESMLREAHEIRGWFPEATIKIPMIETGLAAVHQLTKEGIPTNVTLIFNANQALIATRAGATYVSVFVGRLDDASNEGMAVIREVREIWDRHDLPSKIIAASLRHPMHLLDSAMAGAHIGTVPYKVLMQSMKHPLTDIGLKNFIADWEKLQAEKAKAGNGVIA
jgi:transaldolase